MLSFLNGLFSQSEGYTACSLFTHLLIVALEERGNNIDEGRRSDKHSGGVSEVCSTAGACDGSPWS